MIEKHYWKIKQAALDIDLCVVSKHHSIEEIQSYYDVGERIFAENRTAELYQKILLGITSVIYNAIK